MIVFVFLTAYVCIVKNAIVGWEVIYHLDDNCTDPSAAYRIWALYDSCLKQAPGTSMKITTCDADTVSNMMYLEDETCTVESTPGIASAARCYPDGTGELFTQTQCSLSSAIDLGSWPTITGLYANLEDCQNDIPWVFIHHDEPKCVGEDGGKWAKYEINGFEYTDVTYTDNHCGVGRHASSSWTQECKVFQDPLAGKVLKADGEWYCTSCVNGECTAYETCECYPGYSGYGCEQGGKNEISLSFTMMGKHIAMYAPIDTTCSADPFLLLDNSGIYDECHNLEDFVPDAGSSDDTGPVEGSLRLECDSDTGNITFTAWEGNDCSGLKEKMETEMVDCYGNEDAPFRLSISCEKDKKHVLSRYAAIRMYMLNDPDDEPCNEEFVFSGITYAIKKDTCISGFFGNDEGSAKVSCANSRATFKQWDAVSGCTGNPDREVDFTQTCADVGVIVGSDGGDDPVYGKLIDCNFQKAGALRLLNSILVLLACVMLLMS